MELINYTRDIQQQVNKMEELLKTPLNEVTGEHVHEFAERLQDIKYICKMMSIFLPEGG